MSNKHTNQSGNLHMIDVSEKSVTTRVAQASGAIKLNDDAFHHIRFK